MAIGLPKRIRDDYEIEEILKTSQRSENSQSGSDEEKLNAIVKQLSENSTILDYLVPKFIKLEEEVHLLRTNQEKLHILNLLEQNKESKKELEEIFQINSNDVVDTKTLEGLLSKYSDGEDSTEWVRSVRDTS